MTAIAISGPPKAPIKGSTKIGFHFGNVLQVLADRYPKLQGMILEQIQNALDANATSISIRVNLHDHLFEISDNGEGASREDMEESFALLGKTRKKEGKFGRFGIGVVSAFGKCDYFTFTSCAKDREQDGFLTWTFDTKKILRESSDIDIPCESQSELLYWPDQSLVPSTKLRSKNRVPWRTRVKVVGIRKDARLSSVNLNALKASIVSSYGKKMLELGAVVKISFTDVDGQTERIMDVVAESYSGTSLPIFKFDSEQSGKVFFRFFLARNVAGKRSGTVNVNILGNPFRIDAKTCLAKVLEDLLEKEIFNDLVSGLFEGDIECENLTLKAERDGFMDDDAFAGLCKAVSDWHRDVGLKHILETQSSKQETLFQETGRKAMLYIESLCRLDIYRDLMNYLSIGTIGKGHTPGKTIGETDSVSISADGGEKHKVNPAPRGTISGRTKPRAGGERKTHIPGTVGGPRGSHRRLVKGHSVGLRFQYAQLTSDQVYEFDLDTGVLTFNYSHEYWQICEINKVALARYQATVAEMVLVLLPYIGKSQYEVQNEILLDYLQLEIHRIVDGDAFFTERNLKKHTFN